MGVGSGKTRTSLALRFIFSKPSKNIHRLFMYPGAWMDII